MNVNLQFNFDLGMSLNSIHDHQTQMVIARAAVKQAAQQYLFAKTASIAEICEDIRQKANSICSTFGVNIVSVTAVVSPNDFVLNPAMRPLFDIPEIYGLDNISPMQDEPTFMGESLIQKRKEPYLNSIDIEHYR